MKFEASNPHLLILIIRETDNSVQVRGTENERHSEDLSGPYASSSGLQPASLQPGSPNSTTSESSSLCPSFISTGLTESSSKSNTIVVMVHPTMPVRQQASHHHGSPTLTLELHQPAHPVQHYLN